MTSNNSFSTYNESPLHAALKAYIALPSDSLETSVDGYIIDVQRDDLLIEIQTRSFAAIKRKLYQLTQNHQVRLIYPIALKKWIIRPSVAEDPTSPIIRRKSPSQGNPLKIFSELVSFPKLINNPNFSIEVFYIHEDEIRHWVGHKTWRRRGWATTHRTLIDVIYRQEFSSADAFAELLPESLPESFTKNDIALYSRCSKRLAGQTAYCLREMGAIDYIGKQGKAYLYQIAT